MKQKLNTKTISTILPMLGLALLLLVSPCKVRNFIQAELGVPKTEVTNKNKATISNTSCSDFEVATSSLTKKRASSQYAIATSTSWEPAFGILDLSNNYIQSLGARSKLVSTIPLYILYQNFKDYL